MTSKLVDVVISVDTGFDIMLWLPIKGVQRHNKTYAARISDDGKLMHLGTYSSEEDAARAYWKAAIAIENRSFFSGSRNRKILHDARPDLYK